MVVALRFTHGDSAPPAARQCCWRICFAPRRNLRRLRQQRQIGVDHSEVLARQQLARVAARSVRCRRRATRHRCPGSACRYRPSPAAPSSASTSACSSTSPSECATTPWLCGTRTPPSITRVAGTEGMHVESRTRLCVIVALPSRVRSMAWRQQQIRGGSVILMLLSLGRESACARTPCHSMACASSVGLAAGASRLLAARRTAARSETSAASAPATAHSRASVAARKAGSPGDLVCALHACRPPARPAAPPAASAGRRPAAVARSARSGRAARRRAPAPSPRRARVASASSPLQHRMRTRRRRPGPT